MFTAIVENFRLFKPTCKFQIRNTQGMMLANTVLTPANEIHKLVGDKVVMAEDFSAT
jgi:hypothetical protein